LVVGSNFLQQFATTNEDISDATIEGALMAKVFNEAKQLFEDMASNNYHWGSKRSQPKK